MSTSTSPNFPVSGYRPQVGAPSGPMLAGPSLSQSARRLSPRANPQQVSQLPVDQERAFRFRPPVEQVPQPQADQERSFKFRSAVQAVSAGQALNAGLANKAVSLVRKQSPTNPQQSVNSQQPVSAGLHAEFQSSQRKIDDLIGSFQNHKSTTDLNHSSLAERMSRLENAFKETEEKHTSDLRSFEQAFERAESQFTELKISLAETQAVNVNHNNLMESRMDKLDNAVLHSDLQLKQALEEIVKDLQSQLANQQSQISLALQQAALESGLRLQQSAGELSSAMDGELGDMRGTISSLQQMYADLQEFAKHTQGSIEKLESANLANQELLTDTCNRIEIKHQHAHETVVQHKQVWETTVQDLQSQLANQQSQVLVALAVQQALQKLEPKVQQPVGELPSAMANGLGDMQGTISSLQQMHADLQHNAKHTQGSIEKLEAANLANKELLVDTCNRIEIKHQHALETAAKQKQALEAAVQEQLENQAQRMKELETKLQQSISELSAAMDNELGGMRDAMISLQQVHADVQERGKHIQSSVEKSEAVQELESRLIAQDDRVTKMLQDLQAENKATLREVHDALTATAGVLSAQSDDLLNKFEYRTTADASSIQELRTELLSHTSTLEQRIAALERAPASEHSDAAGLQKKIEDIRAEMQEVHAKLESAESDGDAVQLRQAMEPFEIKLDQMLIEQERGMQFLRKEMEDALRESHRVVPLSMQSSEGLQSNCWQRPKGP